MRLGRDGTQALELNSQGLSFSPLCLSHVSTICWSKSELEFVFACDGLLDVCEFLAGDSQCQPISEHQQEQGLEERKGKTEAVPVYKSVRQAVKTN